MWSNWMQGSQDSEEMSDADQLTNNFGSDVLGLRLWGSDVDADRFANWDWTQPFTPATHVGHVDD